MDTPRPKLRSDLIISCQRENGTEYYVVKDPLSGRFFRLKEKEYYIATLFDSVRNYGDVAADFERRFNIGISHESIAQFHDRLESLGLMEKNGEITRPVEPTLYQKRPLVQKILFVKIKAVNPDNLLERSLPYARWLYSRYMMPIYAAIVFLALTVLLSNRLELGQQLKTVGPGAIPLIYITVIFVTILHEFSHAYACKYYGGKVSEMGFLLLYFFLYFYTNISDAYLFPERRKRIAVTAAGLANQIIVWALALLVWRVMAVETIFNHVAFIIVAISFIGIIFNLNPLLKLDGYYYLVDRLGIPNLRARAFGYWKYVIFAMISPASARPDYPAREKRIYFWYGLAAMIYSTALFGFILNKFSGFIFDKIGVLGVIFLYAAILFMIGEAAKKAGFWKIVASERGNILKPKKWITTLVAAAGILVLSAVIRIDLKISQDCLIYPIELLTIKTDQSGLVELVLDRGSGEKSVQRMSLTGDLNVFSIDPVVEEGQAVKRGELVARISSSESESELVESRANLDRAKYQLELLRKGPRPEEIDQTEDLIAQVRMKLDKSNADLARSQELSSRGLISKEKLEEDKTTNEVLKSELNFYQRQKRLLKQGARPEEIAIAEADIRAIDAKISRLESQLAANNICSPIDGVVTEVKTGSDIITVARTDTMRVRIPVPEKEIGPVAVGQTVKLKARGYPGRTFNGHITRISGQTEAGGLQPVFVVTAEAPNDVGIMKPGMTGRAANLYGSPVANGALVPGGVLELVLTSITFVASLHHGALGIENSNDNSNITGTPIGSYDFMLWS
jgi:multidrug efflux pump subunit AcrA (membrane-fusion protein)